VASLGKALALLIAGTGSPFVSAACWLTAPRRRAEPASC
jgi:hypothetical protein